MTRAKGARASPCPTAPSKKLKSARPARYTATAAGVSNYQVRAVVEAAAARNRLLCSIWRERGFNSGLTLGGSMKRVTGIGGIFFKAKDAPALQAWYKRHLGIDVQEWGGAAFTWTDGEGKPVAGTTIWSIGSAQGDQFAPSTATFMVNYRVEDLHALVKVLREEGCNVLEKIDESEYGKFAWVIDPEGNKVELWQPPAGQ
jgi:predicted enzyme related to lactoylglutathione lyase